MNLAAFITANLDPILEEWERFARTLPSAASMDSLALRDHARQILEAVAKDIVVPQTSAESGSKSHGDDDGNGIDTAAAVHGALRHTAGFDLPQLFGEYRALRASVLRLWAERAGETSPGALYQMTRFNEAIDQALAESVARFSGDVARSRDTFIAVLGHDLRSPLLAVGASVGTLADIAQPEPTRAAALARVRASLLGMSQMIRDLLEYTRTRLGKTIPINCAPANVESIVRESVAEVVAGYPQRSFRVETGHDLQALVDPPRLQQAITNLLGNAIEHGRRGSVVELIARKDAGMLAIEVTNEGPAISAETLKAIFDPSHAEPLESQGGAAYRLGLGLFIAREIAQGHGGTIEAQSSDRRTTFTLRIPLRTEKNVQAAALPAVA